MIRYPTRTGARPGQGMGPAPALGPGRGDRPAEIHVEDVGDQRVLVERP